MKKIIEENKKNIRSIIKNIVGQQNEDIEQEVYIKVWKNQNNTINSISKFKMWINKVTANTCKDFLKSKQNRCANLENHDDNLINEIKETRTPEKLVESKQRQKMILKAVDELPKKMREVIILYEFEQKSYEDISKKLDIPIGTVKSRLSCARTVLKEELKELIGD